MSEPRPPIIAAMPRIGPGLVTVRKKVCGMMPVCSTRPDYWPRGIVRAGLVNKRARPKPIKSSPEPVAEEGPNARSEPRQEAASHSPLDNQHIDRADRHRHQHADANAS